ncbi:hypothetical protein HYY75_10640 [bacterium]|nr:hypothetical protein [bacterium]
MNVEKETVSTNGPAKKRGPPGLRFWWTDAVMIGVAGTITWGLFSEIGEWALLIPFVVGNFFLFCNIFLVGTRREMFWSLTFLVNFLISVGYAGFSPADLSLVQVPITLGVIIHAIRDPNYHGWGYSHLRKTSFPT